MQEGPDARALRGEALAQSLREARARTKAWTFDLTDEQWLVPLQSGVNLPAWELAHVVWFGEFWVMRGPHESDGDGMLHAREPPRISGPDVQFDSARLPHASRWSVRLPSRGELEDQLKSQLASLLAALEARDGSDASLYFHRLALFHEDMHAEAFAWMRATLGYPAPGGLVLARMNGASPIHVAAERVPLGWPPGRAGFFFDNEHESHSVNLAAYEIDATPVSAGDFEQFVNAGGYADATWWPGEAGHWRATQALGHPARWRRTINGWETRWFDRWLPLDPHQPAIHLSAWEAEAYARWRGHRLPTAAEWEHAASANRTLRWGGSVWEWTDDSFQPYRGFAPGPYRDYSAPWFGDHRELRGGSFATHARMHDVRYRNFFQPSRNDIFAGFRTARST